VHEKDRLTIVIEDQNKLDQTYLLPHSENGTRGNVAVDVRGTVQRVKCHTVLAYQIQNEIRIRFNISGLASCAQLTCHVLWHNDWFLVLFRNQDSASMGVVQGVDKHFVGQNVQLLLLISGGIFGAVQAICAHVLIHQQHLLSY
jgi:hypothetical protein